MLDSENAEQIEARYDAIIAALRGAAEKAPDNGTSDTAVDLAQVRLLEASYAARPHHRRFLGAGKALDPK